MNLLDQLRAEHLSQTTRRHFLRDCVSGLGALWFSSQAGTLYGSSGYAGPDPNDPLRARTAHFAPRAKRVIYLHMAGAPSQLDLFDYKPELFRLDGKDCPSSFLEGQRFAFISGIPSLLAPRHRFQPAGKSGQMISELLPNFREVIDEVCFIKSMKTDQFNHAPAQLLLHTGNAQQGHASMGAWATYGLGSENQNLPGFMVLVSGGKNPSAGKAAWSSGYLPSVYQGVQCRSEGDPILFLKDPDGVQRRERRRIIDTIDEINRRNYEEVGDPETLTRMSQYEMAYRMQIHASDALDMSKEPEYVHESYGTQPGKESFANNCLLARRLVERGVRFVQLYDWGWDHHGTGDSTIDKGLAKKCRETDRPIAALLKDLKQRGLLDETLVIWGGEFGRTPMRELRGGVVSEKFGRDHHKEAFTMWMAGAGVKGGYSIGETDELGFFVKDNPVHVKDLQSTILHLLGLDSQKLVYPYQGLDQKLTGVGHVPRVVEEIFV
ncbi:DUF1501 domain-containing protein [Pelagicoccus enzymogenes]|uniref:DUF1501 domain-containing protein n=1 Tax=Pelagicoccus enzymogenes TaxID=2773457 RepID=UPI00280C8E96|nr:DUF1501 domain-containing protein [Pelagicoccus enzymogenes]MDQ8197055.1 DUF1501 domain-containing protein [Pelagicoccus enzymogenes]